MKQILLLFAYLCSYLSHAGIKVWTTEEEANAANLFAKYCSGSEDRGTDGNIFWVCKRPQRQVPLVESYLHIFQAVPTITNRKQAIFVENPPTHYRHMISVRGQVSANPETNVYILPGKDTHALEVKEDIKTSIKSEKPSIFFVKDDDTENNQESTHLTQSYDNVNENVDISTANSFEYTKHPQPPAYMKRRRVKTGKNIREKRNYGKDNGRSQATTLFEEKTPKKKRSNEEKTVTLHYRRRNPARFGYGRQQQQSVSDDEEEYVPAASSYYPNPYQHLRPVYIRPQQ